VDRPRARGDAAGRRQGEGKRRTGMSAADMTCKRTFDVVFSLLGILLLWPVIALCWLVAAIETRGNGFFIQRRIGRHGAGIAVYKIKTMYPTKETRSAITVGNSAAISKSGRFFRRYKLDELPQLFNVLCGDMSLVGPRPDVAGYADRLEGDDRVILSLRPGITGPASIKYKNEEALLAEVDDPVSLNDNVIWPDKVNINKAYLLNYSLRRDLAYIAKTLLG
jgi:lipopolysaccharide/colanic/teichoic acid biosynthesis glycosyltransferase